MPLLVGLVGADRTKRILLLQERIEAAELVSLGLVMSLTPAAEPPRLQAAADLLVEKLLASSPLARSMTKRAVAAAQATPGMSSSAFEPFLAGLSVELRGAAGYLAPKAGG